VKRFAFSLEQALGWRRTQALMERLRAEKLRAELRAIDEEREKLRAEKEIAGVRLRSAESALGVDLEALDRFRRHADQEDARLQGVRAECEKRIIAQMKVVTAKQREVKVLEHLRDRRLEAWTADLDREIEQQASEAFLARWRSEGRS
jgi:hypothetical protein